MFTDEERAQVKKGALEQWGRSRSNSIVGLMLFVRALPFLAVAAVIAAIAFGISRINLPSVSSPGGAITSVPILIWLAIATLVVGGVWAIAPGRIFPPGTRAIRVAAVITVAAGMLGLWLGFR